MLVWLKKSRVAFHCWHGGMGRRSDTGEYLIIAWGRRIDMRAIKQWSLVKKFLANIFFERFDILPVSTSLANRTTLIWNGIARENSPPIPQTKKNEPKPYRSPSPWTQPLNPESQHLGFCFFWLIGNEKDVFLLIGPRSQHHQSSGFWNLWTRIIINHKTVSVSGKLKIIVWVLGSRAGFKGWVQGLDGIRF